MKKNISAITCLLFFTAVFLHSCTEKAEDPTTTVTRSNYLGTWSVTKTQKSTAYIVTITADPGSSNGVFISNFANIGNSSTPAGASVSGATITLDADQVINDLIINGSGTLSGNKITMTYTINSGADLITYHETFTKQ